MKKLLLVSIIASIPALAEEAATAAATTVAASGGITNVAFIALAAGLAIGLAVLGGTLAQSRAAASALEGMARNPSAGLLVPMIIGLALIESLVILGFLISNGLLGIIK